MLYSLEELFDLQMGKTPSRNVPNYWNTNDNKWISIGDLSQSGKYIYETKEYLSDIAVAESGIKIIPANTVIMSFKLSIGKVAITKEDIYSNEAIMAFNDKQVIELLPEYIYYLFRQKDWSVGTNKAVMGKTLNKATLSQMKIDVCPVHTQREIVTILNKVSEILDNLKEQITRCDKLIKSRFVEMFGNPISNPMGWDKKPLANECDIVTGNTPSRKVPEYYGDYIEWIKSDNINTPNAVLTTAEEYLSEEGLKVGRSVDAGAILMTCIAGSIGCIGNVAIANRTVSFNQQINGIVPKKNNTWFMYVLFELSKGGIQSTINMALKGILSKGQLAEMEFIFPPVKLQNEFGEQPNPAIGTKFLSHDHPKIS